MDARTAGAHVWYTGNKPPCRASQPNRRSVTPPMTTAHTLHPADAVDLQMHTIYSDGAWTPAELLDHLAGREFRLVAVTDHDTVEHVPELQAAGAARDVIVLAATECSTEFEGRMADLLCFGFDPAGGHMATLTAATRAEELRRARAALATLEQQGYAFPRRAAVLPATAGAIGHTRHVVTLLREHGHAADVPAAVRLIQGAGFESARAPLGDAIAACHADGGVALIAHPGRNEPGFTLYTPELLDRVRAAGLGLDGIEVYYPLHSATQVAAYEQYVQTHGWLASSGSDSHGPRQRLPIAYPAGQIAPLLAQCGVPVAA